MPHQPSPEGYLSVTEVLSIAIAKPFLYYWAGKNGLAKCEQIKKESQELGTAVHEQIEQKFKSEAQSLCSNNAQRMLNNFWNDFVVPYNVQAKELEVTLRDEKLKLQGTFDAVVDINGELFIADWKTSNSLDKVSVPLQLSAYNHLHGKEINRGLAVRIDKEKDKVEIKIYPSLEPYWPIFKSCLQVARFVKEGL